MKITLRTMAALLAAAALAGNAMAWDAHGHRTIALLAIDVMDSDLVKAKDADAAQLAWLLTPESRSEVGYQAGEPDRYRAIRSGQLKHINDPDHYIDIEDLSQFGLTLSTLPPLRYEYLRAMAIAKHEHPESAKPYNERTDPARTQEWPGFAPYSIMEHYGKLISSYRQIRILNAINEPSRAFQVAAARANVIYEMGQLAHFVGDAAQPLHTTAQHHGWVGENPHGYTTNKGFHAYIDTTIVGVHGLSYDTLKGKCTIEHTINANDPWQDVIAYIQHSFELVEPLYVLQKSGELEKEPGKAFIEDRFCDGGSMLGALYAGAWKASQMTDKDVKDFLGYDQPSKATPNPMDTRPTEDKPAASPASSKP